MGKSSSIALDATKYKLLLTRRSPMSDAETDHDLPQNFRPDALKVSPASAQVEVWITEVTS